MSSACISNPRDLSDIAALMANVDCRIAQYVEAAYAALFGPFGWLGPALTGALTIYVALYAYGLLTGRGGLSATTLSRRFIAIGAVVALSSNWAAYQTLVVGAFFGGADDLSAMALGAATGGAPSASGQSLALRIDAAFDAMTQLASAWGHNAPLTGVDALTAQTLAATPQDGAPPVFAPSSAVNLLWFSAIALGVGSAGVVIVAKVALGFLLAFGPLFILLALFPQTRGLFEGWLRAVAMNAFTPAFVLLATAGFLPIIEPLIATVAFDQRQGIDDAEPVFVLALASAVFVLLVAQVVFVSSKLTSAWRLPDAAEERAIAAAPAAAASAQSGTSARVAEIVAAATRHEAPGAASAPRARVTVETNAGSSAGAAGYAFDGRRRGAAYRGFGAGQARSAAGATA